MRLFFVLSMLLLAGGAFADEKVTVRVEHSSAVAAAGTDEQVKLTFDDGEVILTENSNFLFGPQLIAELGERSSPVNEKMRADLEELRRISLRTPDAPTSTPSTGPATMRILVGKNEFDPDSSFGKIVMALIQRIRDEGVWKTKRLAIVKPGPSDPRFNGYVHMGAGSAMLHCADNGASLRCTVPGYGTAYLQKKDSPNPR